MKENQRKDGLIIANYIAVTLTGNKKRKPTVAADFLLLFTGIYGSLSAFITSFEIAADIRMLIIGLTVLSLIYYGIECLKKGKRYLIFAFFFIQAFVIWKAVFYIENGFYYMENAMIEKTAAYYGFPPISFVAEGDELKCTAALFLVIGSILSFFLVTAIRFQLFRSMFYIASGLLVAAGFLVGVIPHPISLICMFLTVYMLQVMEMVPAARKALYAGEGKKRQEIREVYKQQIRRNAVIFTAGILFLLLSMVALIFPPEKYKAFEPDLRNRKSILQKQMTDFFTGESLQSVKDVVDDIDWGALTMFEVEEAGGGMSGGRLGGTEGISYTKETALVVTVPKSAGTIYLKGFAGAYYSGNLWGALTSAQKSRYQDLVDLYGGEFDGESLSEFLYLGQEDTGTLKDAKGEANVLENVLFYRYPLQLWYKNASRSYLYLPYETDLNLPFSYEAVDDLYYVALQKQKEYQINYRETHSYSGLIENARQKDAIPEAFWKFEEEYRKFVYESYLQLPDAGIDRLKALDLGVDYFDGSGASKAAIIRAVKEYLSQNTVYTLTPGRLPVGADFVENFLFDTKKGYCMHYASAAVLLFRKYGIPARYVEGYVVTKSDIASAKDAGYQKEEMYLKDGSIISQDVPVKQVEVTDESAHAWAEVYEDGYGWVPVEVTVGYMEEEETIWEEEPEVTKKPETKEEQEQNTAESEDVKEELTITPTEKPSYEENKVSDESVSAALISKETRILLIILALSAAVMTVLTIRRIILTKVREKKISPHNNEAVLFVYEQMLRIRRGMRNAEEKDETEDMLETVHMLALKARFSNQEVTEEEYQIVIRDYELLRMRFYKKASNIEKIYAKFLKVL